MTRKSAARAICFLTAAVVGTVSAQQQPTIIQPSTTSAPNGVAPNGIGATTTELLFSQPFGTPAFGAPQSRGIYSATNLTASGGATITETISLPTTLNAENYFNISAGFGGFTSGAVYATNPSSASTDAVLKNGAPFIDGIPDQAPGHAGITFDTVGTFGLAMIVTTPSGVFGFNSTGAPVFSYPAPSGFLLESASVAPLTNSACPGCLYLTSESIAASQGQANPPNGNIYVIKPNTPSGTAPTLVATAPGVEPESILFVTPQLCTLSGTNFSYFVSGYAAGSQIDNPASTSGALLAYTQSQIAELSGQALIPFEGTQAQPGNIVSFNPLTNSFTPFSTPTPIPAATPSAYQLEGASLVACTSLQNACVLPPSGTAISGAPVSWNGFNAPAGSVVWINAHISSPKNVPTNTVTTVDFTGVTLVVNTTSYALPNGQVVFNPATTTPSTVVNADGSWTTTVNPSFNKDIFFVGQAIPVDSNLENGGHGNTGSTLSFFTNSNDSTLQFQWQWGAAVYTSWPGNAAADIEPVPMGALQAGAPQNGAVQADLIQGPRGGGGSNFTGSWSGTGQGTCHP